MGHHNPLPTAVARPLRRTGPGEASAENPARRGRTTPSLSPPTQARRCDNGAVLVEGRPGSAGSGAPGVGMAQGAPGLGFDCGRPEQMLAPAFRLRTVVWGPGLAPAALPPAAALPFPVPLPVPEWAAAGALTPAKSLPISSVTGPGRPVCGAGSASRSCGAGGALGAGGT